MLNITGPTRFSETLREANMMPSPFRCELRPMWYDYKGKSHAVQEIWTPENKFIVKQNCFMDIVNLTQNCMQTDQYLKTGVQNTYSFKGTWNVVRALKKTEQKKDDWNHMKTCKGCNDYGELYRSK